MFIPVYLSSPFPFSNRKLVFYVCGFSDHFKCDDPRSKITFTCHNLFSFNLVSQPIFMILILTFKKYLILIALGLHCFVWAFSSYSKQGLPFNVVPGLLIVVASLVA